AVLMVREPEAGSREHETLISSSRLPATGYRLPGRQRLGVYLQSPLRRLLPREVERALAAELDVVRPDLRVRRQSHDAPGDGVDVQRIDEEGVAARNLLERGGRRRQNRRAARHRLHDREAEALVQGGVE